MRHLLLFLVAAIAGASVPIARAGRALVKIVTDPAAASAEEAAAAASLADYLQRVSGATFAIAAEDTVDGATPAIYVGSTAFADSQGIHTRFLSPQECRVRTCAGSLIICGGRPLGTTFGVWRFLEEVAGCRWYTVFDEVVPSLPNLDVPDLDAAWVPAFRCRELYRQGGHQQGPYGQEAEWLVRNRMHKATIGRPANANTVHTFLAYFDPRDYVDDHPEWSSWYAGGYHRKPSDQFCLTKPGPRAIVGERFARIVAEQPGRDYYELSQNDGNQGRCQCPTCLAIEEKEGKIGPLLDFVNAIAATVPDVTVRTLAYNYTGDPPTSMRAAPNVGIRKCLNSFQVHLPLDDPANASTRTELAGWQRAAGYLAIWEYDDRPGELTGLPIPAFASYASRYRAYLQHGVQDVFSETEMLVKPRQLVGMKHWVQMKLMEDPQRDVWALVDDFANGVYGPAAPQVVAYVKLLEDRRKDWPWKLFDVPFFVAAQNLMDQAEAAAKADPKALARVHELRFFVDIAQLLYWSKAQTDWARTGGDPTAWKSDKAAVVARTRPYLQTLLAEDRWLTNTTGRGERDQWAVPFQELFVDPICAEAEAARDLIPLPAELANVPAHRVVEFPVPVLRYGPGLGTNVHGGYRTDLEYVPRPDPDAAAGLAIFIDDARMKAHGGIMPLALGVYDFTRRTGGGGRIGRDDVKAPGYQLYRMVRTRLTDTAYIYFPGSWQYQVRQLGPFLDPAAPDQLWDIYLSARFSGPDMPFGDPDQPNGVWVDRLILVQATP